MTPPTYSAAEIGGRTRQARLGFHVKIIQGDFWWTGRVIPPRFGGITPRDNRAAFREPTLPQQLSRFLQTPPRACSAAAIGGVTRGGLASGVLCDSHNTPDATKRISRKLLTSRSLAARFGLVFWRELSRRNAVVIGYFMGGWR